MLDPVAEFNPLDDFGQSVLAVEFAPFLLGRQHQLVGHGERRFPAQAALGLGGSVCSSNSEPPSNLGSTDAVGS